MRLRKAGHVSCPECETALDAETLQSVKDAPEGVSCPSCGELLRWQTLHVLH